MFDLEPSSRIAIYCLVWGGLLLLSLSRLGRSRYTTIGLSFAFLAGFTAPHAGALIYLSNSYDVSQNAYLRGFGHTPSTVADGLEVALLAMIAATAGMRLSGLRLTSAPPASAGLRLDLLRKGSIAFLAAGVCVLVLDTALARIGVSIPGLQAVFSTTRNLLVVGACGLILHRYITAGSLSAMTWTAWLAASTPAILLVTTAILADSVVLAIVIAAFFLALPSRRGNPFARNLIAFMIVVSFTFLFAATYLQKRNVLREVVWGGGSIGEAVNVTLDVAQNFDLQKSFAEKTLYMIDARLNQNLFVGLAVEKLRALPNTYENGATIELAIFGWVPRFLWPDKPERGGSAFLSKHTGLAFSEGTTFGAGPIFEFYVNFGYWGVVLGFVLLGYVIGLFEGWAFAAIVQGQLARFAQFQLAGISMIAPLSDLFFMVTAVAAALILGAGLRVYWNYAVRPAPARGRTA